MRHIPDMHSRHSSPNSGRPLRVLLVVEPGLNGVFRHVEALCDYLISGQNAVVALAFSSKRSSDALVQLVNRVKRSGGPVLDLQVANNPSAADVLAFVRLLGFATRFSPDIIHSHSSKAGALSRALWWAGCSCVQYYTPHAYYGLNAIPGVKSFFYNFLESYLGQIGITINVSDSERAFALSTLGLDGRKLRTVANAVDCEKFHPPSQDERREIRRALGIPWDAWVVGSVGRYSSQKDPHTLYAAVGLFLDRNPNAWFAHLGEGELFDEIDAQLIGRNWAKRVVRVRYESKPAAFYRALDVFVLSSRYEGLPISAIEAIATGLPLVMTRCPGCEDFAQMGLPGLFWSEIGCATSLAEAMSRVREDVRIGRVHRAVTERRFSPEVVYGSILDHYRRDCAGIPSL